jgi:pimeloyl-ACP methyl ester carboxylesterase
MSKTVVFIHGAWMSPASWDLFKGHYEKRGFTCLAPAWPYDNRPVPELQRSPDPKLASVGIEEIVTHYANIVKALPERAVLIGHSFGGLIVQILLDRGMGAAGIAIDPAPARGVLPGSQALRASLPVFLTWKGWKKVLTMPFQDSDCRPRRSNCRTTHGASGVSETSEVAGLYQVEGISVSHPLPDRQPRLGGDR